MPNLTTPDLIALSLLYLGMRIWITIEMWEKQNDTEEKNS